MNYQEITADYIGLYFDHYEKFLGKAIASYEVTLIDQPPMHVLTYNVAKDFRAFCTLGICAYRESLGQIFEVFLLADDGYEFIPKILCDLSITLVNNLNHFSKGYRISGIERVFAEFPKLYDKSSLYFTTPDRSPKNFDIIHLETAAGAEHGTLYEAVLISRQEHDFLRQYEWEAFEEKLSEYEVDTTNIKRKSIV